MSTRVEVVLLAGAVGLGLVANQRIRSAGVAEPMPSGAAVPQLKSWTLIEPSRLQIAAAQTSNRDPFRLSRQPSTVPYVPGGAPPPPTPVLMIPQLTVRGIVGGPPWQAVTV